MKKQTLWEKVNNQEFMGGVIAFIMFGAIKLLSMRLPTKVSTYPIAMSNVGFALACLLLARCVFRLCRGTLAPKKMFESTKDTSVRFVMTLILLVIYAVCFSLLGVIFSTFLFVFIFSQLFGEKKGSKVMLYHLGVAAGVTAVIYIVFSTLLGIPLPTLFL